MASRALLGIVSTLCQEIGLPVPATVVGSVSMQVAQMVALANAVGDELRDEYDWPVLRKLASITTGAGTETYALALAGGFSVSRIIQETGWDQTNSWYFVGSIGDDEWNWWQYGILTSPIRRIWRTASDSSIEVFPIPATAGDTLVVSTIAAEWALSAAAVPKDALSADDDTHVYNDRLFILGVKYRFLAGRGLPFAVEKAEYDRMLPVRKAAARPGRTLSLAGNNYGPHFIDYRNVPPTGFGP